MHLRKHKHQPFSRRGFLGGVGATLALPFFESWVPGSISAANASPTEKAGPPLRMGIYSIGAGTVIESFAPEESCDLKSLPRLPSILRSLDFARDDMLILSGLAHNGRVEGLNGHKSAWYMHLTGADYAADQDGKPINSISVDQRAAQLVGKQSLLPDLRVGPDVPFSFRENGTPLPAEAMPSAVFARMFRGRTPVVPNWEKRADVDPSQLETSELSRADVLRKSVLDVVLRQAKELRKTMGRADQVKLDEYLDSVRGVEASIEKFERRIALEALDRQNPGPSELVRGSVPSQRQCEQLMELVKSDPNFGREYIGLKARSLAITCR